MTKDTVPVNVDAVLFWVVWDAEKAGLEVKDYQSAISWSAQTALRDIIGKMMLADIPVGRKAIDLELQKIIDQRTTPWDIIVQADHCALVGGRYDELGWLEWHGVAGADHSKRYAPCSLNLTKDFE